MNKNFDKELLEAIFGSVSGDDCECDCCDAEVRILVEGEEVEWTMDIAVAIMEAAMGEMDDLFEKGLQDSDAYCELEDLACLCSDIIDTLREIEVLEEEEQPKKVNRWEVIVDYEDSHHIVIADKFRDNYAGFIYFYNESDGVSDLVAIFKQERVVSIKRLS